MANATTLRQHPNAPLTPEGRRRMVRCVIDRGWTIEATADRFQVDAKTVRKWRDRYLAEGEAGLVDRSSRPHRSPNRTPRQMRRKVCRIRKKRRWGADHIAHEVGLAASTVQNILNQAGLGRLDHGDRATDTATVRRYQRDLPGELIHVDIKKIAGTPTVADGGSVAAATKATAPSPAVPATATSTPHSTTAAASHTPRSSTTNKASQQPASGSGQHNGSRRSASSRNGSSPTTAPATNRSCGTRPVNGPARR